MHVVEGSESNVVGLPMELLAEMLEEIAERLRRDGAQLHLLTLAVVS